MCCHWVRSERPKALIPRFNSILTLFHSPQHKNSAKFGGKLHDGLFGNYKGSKNEFICHSLFNTVWNMHILKIRQLSGHTHTKMVNRKKAICQHLCHTKWNSGTTDIKKEKRKHQSKGISVGKHNVECGHQCLNDTISFIFIHTTSKMMLSTDIHLHREKPGGDSPDLPTLVGYELGDTADCQHQSRATYITTAFILLCR